MITDYATTYYICDVIIYETHRGQGLGKKLVESMIEFEGLYEKLGILATKDAHEFYKYNGFIKDEKSFMRRIPNK